MSKWSISSRFGERLRIALSIPFSFKNWTAVYRNILSNVPISRLELRTGEIIHGREDTQLWIHYNDIWNKAAYTQRFAVPKGATVIDIGANVGIFSLLAAKSARLVHAFEPEPRNYDLIEQNCHGKSNIVIHNEAIGAIDGTAPLSIGSSSTAFSLYGEATQTRPVPVRTLSSIFSDYDIEYCDFLKLDCEGAEYPILLDSPPEIFNKIGLLAMEYHDHLSSHTHQDIVNRLRMLGFQSTVYHVSGTFGMIAAWRDSATTLPASSEGPGISTAAQPA
jgi:FkbM family methyltransferase